MEPVFPFEIDASAAVGGTRMQSLHLQLRAAILDGRLPAGAMMPSTRDVASALGIARNTVVSAYDLLIAEGYVLPRRAARAVVADVAPRRRQRSSQMLQPYADPRLNALWRQPALHREAPRDLPERCFRLGIPEHRHFPHGVWRRLWAQSLRVWDKMPFHYPPSEGLPALRQAIARHVAFARAVA